MEGDHEFQILFRKEEKGGGKGGLVWCDGGEIVLHWPLPPATKGYELKRGREERLWCSVEKEEEREREGKDLGKSLVWQLLPKTNWAEGKFGGSLGKGIHCTVRAHQREDISLLTECTQ